MKCSHYACLCTRRAQLADMADRTGNGRLLVEAILLQETECLHPFSTADTAPADPAAANQPRVQ